MSEQEWGRPPSARPPDPLIGRTVDQRYSIEGVLGEGGMGLVYKARHASLNKPVAMKVLKSDVSKDAEIMARFKQEAQSASAIGNPHIIDITDFGSLPDGSTYFVMEHLDGMSLTQALEETKQFSVQRLTHVVVQICSALYAAHKKGIIHRDLKPDNIFLIERGDDTDFVKVLDFGIAKVGVSASKLTKAGQVFGTPHYMSPEQCTGRNVDERADIYALGIIMFELFTGKVPFDGDSLISIVTQQVSNDAPKLSSLRSDTPGWLETIVEKCIAKDPAQRFSSMKDLANAFKAQELKASQKFPVFESSEISKLDRKHASAVGFNATVPSLELDALKLTNTTALPKPASKLPLLLGGALVLILGGAAAWWSLSTPTTLKPEAREATAETGIAHPIKPSEAQLAVAPDVAAVPVPVPITTGASAMAPKIEITSEPIGADIFLDGKLLLGKTPFSLTRPVGNQTYTVELRHTGYQSLQALISTDTQPLNLTLQRTQGSGSRTKSGGNGSSGSRHLQGWGH